MKTVKDYINESFLNSCVKKYEKDIYKYLETRKWDDLYDILQEYGYGDEYYDLVDEVLNNLNVDEKHKDYEDLRYGLQNAIKTYLVKNKMWK
jgi:hypothetical protein